MEDGAPVLAAFLQGFHYTYCWQRYFAWWALRSAPFACPTRHPGTHKIRQN